LVWIVTGLYSATSLDKIVDGLIMSLRLLGLLEYRAETRGGEMFSQDFQNGWK